MSNSKHVCLRVAGAAGVEPVLDLGLTYSGFNVRGFAVLHESGTNKPRIEFSVSGTLRELVFGGSTEYVLTLEGQTLNLPNGSIQFGARANSDLSKGAAAYRVHIGNQDPVNVTNVPVQRTECPQV